MDHYFTESGYSHQEVIINIRIKYGDRAQILSHKSVRLGGFLGFFAKDGVEYTGYIPEQPAARQKEMDEKNKQEILGLSKSGQDARQGSTINDVLNEIMELKEKIGIDKSREPMHPSLNRMKDILKDNDFSDEYTNSILDRLRKNFSLEDLDQFPLLEDAVMQWIAESIIEQKEIITSSPRIFVLVGPTGVGKTTTIAKLAAINHIRSEQKPMSVCMITIDNYRIGAKNQIETYGEIMQIPVFSAESHNDLKEKIALNKDLDMILIDTTGKSPRNYMKLAEIRSIIEACGKTAEIHLAISATTKDKDIIEILDQFEPFHYISVILTKLDETTKVGNLISILSGNKKALSHITDGQGVPQDISCDIRANLLQSLTGFSTDIEALLQKFQKPSPGMWN